MRVSAYQALGALSSHPIPQACRFIVGRRFPLPRRTFHSSSNKLSAKEPNDVPQAAWSHVPEGTSTLIESEHSAQELGDEADSAYGGPQTPPKPINRRYYGSATRRAVRNVAQKEETPPCQIPQWFMDRNVTLREAISSEEGVRFELEKSSEKSSGKPSGTESSPDAASTISGDVNSEDSHTSAREDSPQPAKEVIDRHFQLDKNIMTEIDLMVSAGLQVPSSEYADFWTSPKPHIVLHCPKEGGTFFLDALAKNFAAVYATDLVELDAQDIAQIGSDYLEEPNDFLRADTLSTLGYDAHLTPLGRESQWMEDPAEEEEYDGLDEEDDSSQVKTSIHQQSPSASLIPIPFAAIADLVKKSSKAGGFTPIKPPSSVSQLVKVFAPAVQDQNTAKELKLSLFIEAVLDASEKKRKIQREKGDLDASVTVQETTSNRVSKTVESSENGLEDTPSIISRPEPHSLIVLIRDYPEINATSSGGKILDVLHAIVKRRRREGQKILVVGTTSSKDLIPSFSKMGFKSIQSQQDSGPTRTIITPCSAPTSETTFKHDRKLRTGVINLRHLQDMVRRLAANPALIENIVSQPELLIESSTVFASGLDESIWPSDRIHRTATVALGLLEENEDMTSKHLGKALVLLDLSDNAKYDWVASERQQEKKRFKSSKAKVVGSTGFVSSRDNEERMAKLRKTCNSYEKKLLNGVIDADSIRTTFADVRAPPETIEALKTLTSLSLVRPDAFTYGVLATDKIPGLLLYGPPGTGKTLLAKAVAKESGATMLEISGSDVYDMYVGEGEKNVKAIFSLAKKLTPCIVFIDEADAILGSRGGSSSRTSHRELINQFLREWDGMNDLSAFIMVATNRPFDLDEASLRRLPRRLLVDLPVEKDREAILQIHLKDEIVDPEVSIQTLASETPFYSGSDLKNLAVAAALACVREEFEAAAAHKTGSLSEQYEYPEKRTLRLSHFTKAMEEISASISEDMGSLSAIRKFDEKYGDRRGRRKKSSYGFGTLPETERNLSDSARVRKPT